MARIFTLVSGVLAIVLANINAFDLSVTLQATITSVGGLLLAIMAYLEHPVTVANAKAALNQSTKGTK